MASEFVTPSRGPCAGSRPPALPSIALAAALALLGGVAAVHAARGARRPEGTGKPAAAGTALAPDSLEAASAVLVDAETGAALLAKEPHQRRPPASMLKMMVAVIVLDQVQAGTRKLDEPVTTSRRAEAMGGSQVYLKQGEVFPLEDMLKAVLIGSANDAAVAVAEHVGGTVEGFVDLMNAKAEALGMKDTRFVTPHGLPPGRDQEADVSSAHDMALLARTLVRYPRALQWTSTKEAPFREGKFILRNPNHLLGAFAGLDGLKTGHYKEAGYNLAATAERDGLRLVAVVMGAPNGKTRFAEAARLLNWGFNIVRREVVVRAGEEMAPVKVRGGVEPAVKLVAARRVTVFRLPGDGAAPEREVQVPPGIQAPVEAGQKVGVVAVKRGGEVVGTTDLVAAKTVPRASLLRRLFLFWR
ncbi:MAG TPA: D-alanyl-D-alanine carboxypeptidase family protein [Candidatus Sulfotelmatobacter sp.]|nr:D-alanyl-D-alanine carboxypeptidase family protein [Candidatus Sulfotelmatobacter sp.]